MRNAECGLRPVGAIGAYAPEGMRKENEIGIWSQELKRSVERTNVREERVEGEKLRSSEAGKIKSDSTEATRATN